MPRIRCSYKGCVYQNEGFCKAENVELDAVEGCLSFTQIDDLPFVDDEWEDLSDEDTDYLEDDYVPLEWD